MFGATELILVLIVVIFFVGGKRLPQIGEGLGRGIASFKRSLREDPSPPTPQKKDLGRSDGHV